MAEASILPKIHAQVKFFPCTGGNEKRSNAC